MNEPRVTDIADLICSALVSDAKKRELVQSAFELGFAHGQVKAAEDFGKLIAAYNLVDAVLA